MTNWEADNLVTHLGAMALYIDGYSTDSFDLMHDLNLEPKKMIMYFMELGCKIGPMRQAERQAFGLKDADAKTRTMARLVIPLTFPVQRKRRDRR
jgi:DNA-directed RNA polymerase I subunit RPA49